MNYIKERDIQYNIPDNISKRNKHILFAYKKGGSPTLMCKEFDISWTRLYEIINKYKVK